MDPKSEVFEHIYTEEMRKAMILEERKRLRKIMGTGTRTGTRKKDSAGSHLNVASGLIDQAAFLSVVLDELDKTIQRDGYVEVYQNGAAQFGTKKSVAADLLDRYTKTYAAVTKQLCELVEDENPEGVDELLAHMNNRPGGVGG